MTCLKRKFPTKKEAKKFLKINNLKYRNEQPLTHVYKCLDCLRWHTTHMDKKKARDKVYKGKMRESHVSTELEMLRRLLKVK